MKQGWTYKKLGEVCEILDSRRKPITKSKRESGSIPYYGATGLLDYVKDYIFDEKLVLLGEDGAKWGAGDRSAFIIEGKTWVNNHAHALRPKRDVLVDELLVYYLNYSNLQPYITGVTVPKLNQEKMRSIVIPIAPVSEQQRIVKRLDAAFAHIDELKANAEKQLSEARALFQKALEKAMEPKDGWEEKMLKDIGKTQTGSTPSKNEPSNYGDYIPFIRPSEIDFDGCGGILYESEVKLSKKGLSNGRRFERGSVLMVCIGATISKVGLATKDISCNQQINVLTPSNEYDSKFLYYAMRSDNFKKKVIKEGTSAQATLPIINKGKWEKLCINIPKTLSTQRNIVARLDSVSENVKKLEEIQRKIIAECDALKQALLRKVFE